MSRRARSGYGCAPQAGALLLLGALAALLLVTDGGPPVLAALRDALSDALSGALYWITDVLRAVPPAPETGAG